MSGSSPSKARRQASIGAQLLRISVAMVAAVLAVLALASAAQWSVHRALVHEEELVRRWALAHQLQHSIDNLRVAAGSAAIHRGGGAVPETVRQAAQIAGEAALVEIGRMSEGVDDADLAARLGVIRKEIADLRRRIEDDLFGLVVGAVTRASDRDAGFAANDDHVDGLCVAIQGRVVDARVVLGEAGRSDLQQLSGDAYRLNLVAMDIIVDRDEGMSEERKEELATAAAALTASSAKVAARITDRGGDPAALVGEVARVVAATTRDLPALVARHVAEQAETREQFRDIGVELDVVGARLGAALGLVVERISRDHAAATVGLATAHARYSWAIMGATAIALIGLIVGLLIFHRRINAGLSVTLTLIRDAVARLAVAAEQFTAGARRVASGAENQASAIQQISATMDEVSATARSNAETARQSESTTSAADTAAGGVTQSVERLGQTMSVIREAAAESAGVVLAIDEIAFQTKILAVNAAIEAARSGRANSGFSVLSEEIRSLAQQSVEAARRTGDRLRESQDRSQAGEEVVREVAQAIAQVLSAVQIASRMAAAVSQSSNEQVRGVEQVNQSIAELNRTVQSNAAEADETLATSAGLRDQAGRLGELVGRLEALVGRVAQPDKRN